MNIETMNLEQVTARLAELDEEVRSANDIDTVNKATNEKKDLLERKAELEELEQRKQNALGINEGMIMANNIDKRNGEMKMEKLDYNVEPAEYRSAYLRDLQGKELNVEERAAITGTAVIPTQTMNMIVGKLEANPLINAIDLTYIPSNISYPVEGTVNDASWVAMGTASTDSVDTITSVALGAYKLIKTIEITADISAMSIDAFETWLVDRLYKKLDKAVDAAILVGTGSNQATGILKAGEITNTGTYTKAAMVFKDVTKIIAKVPTQYLSNASFVMPRTLFYGEVLGMTDTTGNRVVVADAQSPAKFNILGYPVIVDDNCTADTVVFGDLKECYKFNFAQSPEVKSDESAGFRTGSTVYRAMALADGKPVNKDAVTVFTRAAS